MSTHEPSLSATSPIPPHVPAHLVFDYDYIADPRLKPDPLVGIMTLSREAPDIFFTPRNGGHWIAVAHQAVFDIARNHEVFSNAVPGIRLLPISFDPPDHTVYRSALLAIFAPNKIKELKGAIRALAVELIDIVAKQGRCEFVQSVSEPLPVHIFMKLLGIPTTHLRELRDAVVIAMNESDHVKRDAWFEKIAVVTGEIIRERQAKREDDLISRLIDTEMDGRKPTFEEMQAYCLMLLTAGLDTVVNAISLITRHLALDQKYQEELRQNPAMIPEAVEELVRRYALTATSRVVRQDYEYRGVPFRTGDNILVMYQSAAIDPRAYPDPEKIVAERKEPSISFGVGRHRCIGSHLAKVELEIFLEEWLSRIPTFRLDPTNEPRMHAGHVLNVERMHVQWDIPPSKPN